MNYILNHYNRCNQFSLVTDLVSGEVICSKCGVVVHEQSEFLGYDTPGYDNESLEKSRVGGKVSLKIPDMGLSTLIENSNKDSTGQFLSTANKQIFHRLRIWDRNSRYSSSEKSFGKAFLLLDSIRSKIGLPEIVIEQSAYLFRKIVRKKILSGRSTNSVLCAVVYISCRMTGTPRTIEDIAIAGNVKKKMLQRIIRFLIINLEIQPQSYSPEEFVTRLCNLGNNEKTTIRLYPLTDPEKTMGVKRSLAIVAANLSKIFPNIKVSKTNISEFLIS